MLPLATGNHPPPVLPCEESVDCEGSDPSLLGPASRVDGPYSHQRQWLSAAERAMSGRTNGRALPIASQQAPDTTPPTDDTKPVYRHAPQLGSCAGQSCNRWLSQSSRREYRVRFHAAGSSTTVPTGTLRITSVVAPITPSFTAIAAAMSVGYHSPVNRLLCSAEVTLTTQVRPSFHQP